VPLAQDRQGAGEVAGNRRLERDPLAGHRVIEGELPSLQLHLTKETLALEAPAKKRALLGENVMKRLNDLAEAFGRKAQTVS